MTFKSNFRQKGKIPIVIHNFKSYDQHLLIHGVKNLVRTVKTVPHNTETFRSLIFNEFGFLDSMMYLSASLDELVRNLKGNNASNTELY
jgi:hypothetical protein